MSKWCKRIIGSALLWCVANQGLGHPIRTSYAEIDFRAATEKLEIAIRLFTDDTETLLTKRAAKDVSITKTPAPEFDELLFAAIRDAFVVKSADGSAQALEWVGRELKDKDQHLWVYLRCPIPGGPVGARLAHRVLRDVFSNQINSIRVRDPGPPNREVVLIFTDDEEQVVRFRR